MRMPLTKDAKRKSFFSRRSLLTGSAALAAHAALAGEAFSQGQMPMYLMPAPATPNYFVNSSTGLDTNDGHTAATAWKTVAKVNASTFQPNDVIGFCGGQSFTDATLTVPSSGSALARIGFTSYGVGLATLAYVQVTDKDYLTFAAINMTGFDLSANTGTHGNVTFQNFTASGGAACGIGGDTGSSGWSNVLIQKLCDLGSDRRWPRHLWQRLGKQANSNITVSNGTISGCGGSGCYFGNVSVGLCQNVVASGNGAASTSGPVGLWTYESNSVVIRFCESYGTLSANTTDGDGFDIDGGCTNCVIEYCYSHGNVGAGFACFNYGALTWNNNTTRYCISENNGRAGTFYGELTIEHRDTVPCTNALIYNNTSYNSLNISAVVCVPTTGQTGRMANNILYSAANTELIAAATDSSGLLFTGNNYFASGTFAISWNGTSYSSFASWQTATGQEKISGANVGLNVNPQLYNPGGGAVIGTPGYAPPLPIAYQLISGSPIIGAGLDLNAQFSINTGTQDYYGNANPRSGVYPIGAYGGPGR
jgi:hypothetical protein